MAQDLTVQDQDADFFDVPFSGESKALAIQSQNEVSLDGNGGALGPMESLMEVFYEMRDSLNILVQIATDQYKSNQDDMRDAELGESDVEGPPVSDGSDEGNEGGGKGGFMKKIKNPFTMANMLKTGFFLLLTAVFAFADKFAKQLEPILKFIKEKVWPNAVDFFMDYINLAVQLFKDIGDKLGTIFSGDATLMERVKALLGIFGDLAMFVLNIGDSLITNVLEMFGVNFAPYDSAGAWVLGKLNEMWEGITGWFSQAGTFISDGAVGIYDWITTKISNVWTGITEWFSTTGTFISDGAVGIYDWITNKISNVWTGITDWFSSTGTFLLEGATGLFDWVKDKIAAPIAFLKDLFSFPESPKEFATKLIDIVLFPYNMVIQFLGGIFGWDETKLADFSLGKLVIGAFDAAWSWISGIFTFGDDGEEYSLTDLAVGAFKDAWAWVKSKFSFDLPSFSLPTLPSFSNMINGVIGGMLPDPDSWIYKFLPDSMRDLAVAAAASNVVIDEPTAARNMSDVWKEEYAKNQAEFDKLDAIDDGTGNMLVPGSNDQFIEGKLFELEMRNEELKSLLMMNQGKDQGGVTVINNGTNTTNNSQSDVNVQGEVSIDHQDKTADALATSF